MATDAQIHANRMNAQKSTGPRTDEGKATASQNAVTHGLLAQQAGIRGDDPGQFEFYRDEMLGELAPAGAMESMLAERVVGLAWRLRRAERIQAEVFEAMLAQDAPDPTKKLVQSMRSQAAGADDSGPGETALGRVVIRDFANYRVFDRLGLYERRLEYSLYRTMAELRRLRLVRRLDRPEAESTPQPPSRTPERPICQTNPISPFAAQKPGFERRNEGQQSVRQAKLVPSGRYEACSRIRSAGPLETERQEQQKTQT